MWAMSQSPEAKRQDSDAAALSGADALLPAVYNQLRELARQRLSMESPNHTLQATALVHEVYLRLGGRLKFVDKSHFFHTAAEAMRRILIEHARAKGRIKRGCGAKPVPLNVLELAATPDFEEIMAFDDAIRRLEEQTPSAAAVVRLRFYAGLNVNETAESLGVSPRTVDREWSYARAWLYRVLCEDA